MLAGEPGAWSGSWQGSAPKNGDGWDLGNSLWEWIWLGTGQGAENQASREGFELSIGG
jgi:hypothetical protein